jgi:hypothetical protein
LDQQPTDILPLMTRTPLICLALIASALTGCDNRTQDGKRWDQIAENLKTDKGVQPFPQAEDPWSSAEHHSGLAW